MVDTRLNGNRIRNHFAYNAWKYALMAVLVFFVWDLTYNATAYRPPADKKLDVYFVVSGADVDGMYKDLEADLLAAFPELEEINYLYIGLGGDEDYASSMQFTTYIAAAQGDLFLLPRDRFLAFAKEVPEDNLLLPLDEYIAEGTIDLGGMDVERGTYQDAVRGIPTSTLYGFVDYGIVPQSLFLCIPSYSKNQDGAAKMIDFLIGRMQTEKPEWYDEYLRKVQMNLMPQAPGLVRTGE